MGKEGEARGYIMGGELRVGSGWKDGKERDGGQLLRDGNGKRMERGN